MAVAVAVAATLNLRDRQQELAGASPTDDLALLVLAGLVVAAPKVVAAVLIDRGERGDRR